MKKYLLAACCFFFCVSALHAQETYVRPASIGISFIFFDYSTPERIRTSSIRQVLKNDQWAGINEMSPGLVLSYFKGLHAKIDFAASITGSFVDNALPERNNDVAFIMETEALLQFKMLSDKYMFTPYLMGGFGASRIKNYYGAFMPVGGGFKINFFDEAAFFINAKYHVPVTTQTVSRHFVYGLGIAGIIGRRNETQ